MSYRVFITGSAISKEAQDLLLQSGCILKIGNPNDSPEEIAQKLINFDPDALIVRQGKITAEVQKSAKRLRVICKHGVGTDNIDIDAASRCGIPVMFTPMANYESVAEHTLALILSLIRKIPKQSSDIQRGNFNKKNYEGLELFGKTIGIIGFGRIGRRVCELLVPFKVKAIVYHPSCLDEVLPQNFSKAKKVEDIYVQADIISLHCPLTSETQGMINKHSISKMKKGTYLINTSRGGLVKEEDLIQALQKEDIAGVALDVFETEPPAKNNPLFSLENAIFTSHISGISDNSFRNMGIDSANAVLSILKDETYNIDFMVNKEIADKYTFGE